MGKNSFLIISIISLFTTFGCGQKSKNRAQTITANEQKPKIETPVFNADSAYKFVKEQVAFGPRVPNTHEHTACANYLINELERFGADVIVQETDVFAFDNTRLQIKNIIGQYQPEKNDRILLFAHWDSRPFADYDKDPSKRDTPILGANDGASGVGVLLEIARHLQNTNTTLGVDIILFDAEDYGMPDHKQLAYKPDTWCLGSQYWAKNPHKKNYYARYGILLDMVGAKNAQFFQEQFSLHFAPQLVNHIWETAHKLGYSRWFSNQKGGMITDDHYYVNKFLGIPSVDIIQYDPTTSTSFGDYWHTHNDTMENIDQQTLKAVGQTVMEVIYNER